MDRPSKLIRMLKSFSALKGRNKTEKYKDNEENESSVASQLQEVETTMCDNYFISMKKIDNNWFGHVKEGK